MNTLAFAFGMLTVVAIIMIIVIVIGMVKVVKQQDKITSLEKWIDDTNRFAENNMQNIDRVILDEARRIGDDIATIHRRIDEVYATIDSRFDKFDDKITGELEHIHRLMDSRFDKFEDKIAKKQILKD
jgi:cell division protein FtsL